MLVTVLPSIVAGMVNVPDAFLSQLVIATTSPVILYFIELIGASSTGLTSATGFSPHPPRSRGSDMVSRIKGKGFMGQGLLFAGLLK